VDIQVNVRERVRKPVNEVFDAIIEISIPVQDQETAKRFYRDTLGFGIVRDKSNTFSAAGVEG
jgi:catechol-2,3-dioxygenase